MREDDRVRVKHMIDAAESIARFIEGRVRADLDKDLLLQFAVLRAVEIIGEAAARVSAETQSNVPQIPWRTIIAMRNRLIHGYFEIDTEIVWKTVTEEIPAIVPVLKAL